MAKKAAARPEKVCVIGAGPSGIAAAKNLLDEGFFSLTVYDQNQDVGGNWLFSLDAGHSSVFETTHIISSKRLSEYHDFPMPADYPDYPSHRQLAAYFQAYARHFELYPYIQFSTRVLEVAPRPQGGWKIASVGPQGPQSAEFDLLVVANGHHWKPRMPEYPGHFSGKILHSHDFKRAEPFRDQRVLVIGGGNSACDVAVETSRVSASTDISWRRGYWILPKFLMGQPSDTIYDKLHWLPQSLRSSLIRLSYRVLQGNNSRYGLPEPDHDIGQTHPTVNSELFYFIRHGKVRPRPDLARLDGSTVHFTDGSQAEYDVIIACTGFWIAHPFFDPGLIDFSQGPVPLYLRMFHPRHPDLVFLGLFQPVGCIWPAAELQAKLAARRWAKKWSPPEDLEGAIRRELAEPDYQQIGTPRHTITVDYAKFKKRLLRALGST